jgi:hypothetical protein
MDIVVCSGSPIGEEFRDFAEDISDGASRVALGAETCEAPPGTTDLPICAMAGRQIVRQRNIALGVELRWERFFIR